MKNKTGSEHFSFDAYPFSPITKKQALLPRTRRIAQNGVGWYTTPEKDVARMKNRQWLIIGVLAVLVSPGVFPQDQHIDWEGGGPYPEACLG
jgi:hypothetical protein